MRTKIVLKETNWFFWWVLLFPFRLVVTLVLAFIVAALPALWNEVWDKE